MRFALCALDVYPLRVAVRRDSTTRCLFAGVAAFACADDFSVGIQAVAVTRGARLRIDIAPSTEQPCLADAYKYVAIVQILSNTN